MEVDSGSNHVTYLMNNMFLVVSREIDALVFRKILVFVCFHFVPSEHVD